MKKYQKIFAFLIVFMFLGTSWFYYDNYVSGSGVVKVSEKKSIKSNSAISMMYETEAGSGEYTESEDTSWPSGGYKFNTTLSKCEKGSSISWDDTNKKVIVSANTSDRCYVYFDKTNDLKITVSTDGNSGVVPVLANYLGYNKTIDCNGASWNRMYNRLEFSNINGSVECNLSYTRDTNTHTTLKTQVEVNALASGDVVNEGTAGYRYEGQNPDNYIWFNNEMWRIIGSIPTCTTASCGTSGSNLVKIIRKDSIGGLVYDAQDDGYTGAWGTDATLYNLLNSVYWGKGNGTDGEYCYGYQNTAKAKCDYTEIGLSANDYYGVMVEEVYWNTGASTRSATASGVYAKEIITQTVQGHVGLMAASDYGFATSGSHNSNLSGYDNATHTLGNWLYNGGYEWTNIQDSSDALNALDVHDSGYVYSNASSNFGYAVRPVVYLSASVYVVDGSGTESDPYIVGHMAS